MNISVAVSNTAAIAAVAFAPTVDAIVVAVVALIAPVHTAVTATAFVYVAAPIVKVSVFF